MRSVIEVSEQYLSIHFEPVTPLFFGTRQELSPYEFAKSLILPSIYTVGGASLRVLSEIYNLNFQDIEEHVKRGDVQVKGPYIVAQFGNKFMYFVPAPYDRTCGIIIDFREAKTLPKLVYERGDGLRLPNIARFEKKAVKPDGVLLVEINFNKAEHEFNVDLDSTAILREMMRDSTSFEMCRDTRVVQHGTLYFRSVIESYTLESSLYGAASKIAIGCDVKVSGEFFKKLDLENVGDMKVRFGGEGNIARAIVKRKEIPLIKAFQYKHAPHSGRVLLAVSHIALKKEDDKLYALEIGEVEWLFGRVELIGGWLAKDKVFKKHVPALVPGSLLKIKNNNSPSTKEWYLKLLSTTLPIF